MQVCTGPVLHAGLYRLGTIRSAVQALYYTQGCTGLALYPELYKTSNICKAVQALHYM